MSAEKINTQDAEFKMIVNKKDEPDYKAVSRSLLVVWLKLLRFLMVTYFFLNEEGKLMGLPLNEEATALWRTHFTKETHITGRTMIM